jgi:hypothetical protein
VVEMHDRAPLDCPVRGRRPARRHRHPGPARLRGVDLRRGRHLRVAELRRAFCRGAVLHERRATPRAPSTATARRCCTPTRRHFPIRCACPLATPSCRWCRCSTSTPGACPTAAP